MSKAKTTASCSPRRKSAPGVALDRHALSLAALVNTTP
jgi:hypothetical protein